MLNVIQTAAGADPSGKEIHFTYVSPRDGGIYRKNGKFVDGTVLVKERLASVMRS